MITLKSIDIFSFYHPWNLWFVTKNNINNLCVVKTYEQLLTTLQPFNGLLSRTTWVSRYQKGKTNLDFTGARDSEWQWHHLGHMQVCTLLQTDNHASTPPLCFFTGRMPFLPPNQLRQSTEGTSKCNCFIIRQSNRQALKLNPGRLFPTCTVSEIFSLICQNWIGDVTLKHSIWRGNHLHAMSSLTLLVRQHEYNTIRPVKIHSFWCG